jgi:hypothetical protein
MSLYPCSFCGQRAVGKLASATWAWWNADNSRVAWRQRLCVACYVTNVAGIEAAVEEEALNCPLCHTASQSDMDPCYLTIFVPAYGPRRIEMATCGACAVEVRNRALTGAVKLDDRQDSSGGLDSGPQTDPALDVWRQLGIHPNE